MTRPSPQIDVHLVRHGETRSYFADVGLTARGVSQSRERGLRLVGELADGERVRVLWAPTARARETAEHLRGGLREGLAGEGRAVSLGEPEPAPDFRNVDVRAPSGPREATQAYAEYRALAGSEGDGLGASPWLREMGRFWKLQADAADPIGFWLTVPLLTFETPADVVRRLWAGLERLAVQAGEVSRVVCCTHSGPMRALAAAVLGHDAGEPEFGEDLRLRLRPALDGMPATAQLSFRGLMQRGSLPRHDQGEKP